MTFRNHLKAWSPIAFLCLAMAVLAFVVFVQVAPAERHRLAPRQFPTQADAPKDQSRLPPYSNMRERFDFVFGVGEEEEQPRWSNWPMR